jgi:hypothetical protein
MGPLTDGLLRPLHAHHGWRRCLLLVQEAGGRVGWVEPPDDLDLALRLNTDDTVSVTLAPSRPGRSVPGRARDAGRGNRSDAFGTVDRSADWYCRTVSGGER